MQCRHNLTKLLQHPVYSLGLHIRILVYCCNSGLALWAWKAVALEFGAWDKVPWRHEQVRTRNTMDDTSSLAAAIFIWALCCLQGVYRHHEVVPFDSAYLGMLCWHICFRADSQGPKRFLILFVGFSCPLIKWAAFASSHSCICRDELTI